MARRTTGITAIDARTEKELHAQIRINRASMESQYRLVNVPTQFRVKYPRAASQQDPKRLIQPHFIDGEIPSLLMAIRLYVELVDHALPLFHTLLLREPKILPRIEFLNSRRWEYPEPHLKLNREEKYHAWTCLATIGNGLDWIVGEVGRDGLTQADTGSTTINHRRPLLVHGLPGYGSVITAAPEIVRHIKDSAKRGDIGAQKWHSFELAATWLHELAHAVVNAVLPYTEQQEVFLGLGATTTEVGFEVEGRVFSGIFAQSEHSMLPGDVVLKEWPNLETIRNYQSEYGFEIRGSAAELRDWKVWWKVDRSFWERMFEDSFWKKRCAVGTLWPEKIFGILKVTAEEKLTDRQRKEMESELRRQECTLGRRGLVLRDVLAHEMEEFEETDSDESDEADSEEMCCEESDVDGDVDVDVDVDVDGDEMVDVDRMDETE
ncbi:unnamed protein product [Zymoseptoria tritici ST99CH_3D7]|uniref:Uncharacterized protein n=1 Tax=Zymoseptoria tritici (strain ST99CH_3D7) TaxID=1276538 RepID=A0A1X7RHP0_ZYMT9|nr:unnamed protein product [Zymoseptoria tritici ST99CH_3D7]